MREAIQQGAVIRFRPIVLTSITTFIGLVPLMFEPAVSAKPLVPMAISLAYGVLCAFCGHSFSRSLRIPDP